ncbi:MAG: pyrophosphate phosphatase [Verrucomicrobiaceae bacterium]|nr:pyrophosphate phosphatase [Verrucomicrobiaceae bacterium]
MPDWLNAILLGLIEGLTEFIPVSSTGHLLIAEHWLGKQSELFNIIIQPAAALALIPIFWNKLTRIIFGLDDRANRDLALKLGVAFLITAVGGYILKKKGMTLPEELAPVAWATLIGGIVIFIVEAVNHGRPSRSQITWTLAIVFGFAQLIAAAFPGSSRSGATIMLAMALGLARPAATEFSFLLGIPTLFAAGGYKVLEELKKNGGHGENWLNVGLASIASLISAFIVVKWLIRFVQTHSFNGFAMYRVLLGIALLVFAAKGLPAVAGH